MVFVRWYSFIYVESVKGNFFWIFLKFEDEFIFLRIVLVLEMVKESILYVLVGNVVIVIDVVSFNIGFCVYV